MRTNGETPVSELYHARNIAYVDLDEDVVVHWKYIKREKLPNGKWRYYYNQSELDNIKKLAKDAEQEELRNALKSATASVNARIQDDSMSEYQDLYKKTGESKYGAAYLNAKEKREQYTADSEKYLATAKRYETVVKSLLKTHRAKSIASFPARIISKGIVAIANLFSR